jgi:hypothetical protein
MTHSIMQRATSKPAKPRPDFPLFPHATGRWAKKVRGKLSYFGKVADDPKGEAALAKWLDQKDYLLAGAKPPADPDRDRLTVRKLVNHYLTAKKVLIDSWKHLDGRARQEAAEVPGAPMMADRLNHFAELLEGARTKLSGTGRSLAQVAQGRANPSFFRRLGRWSREDGGDAGTVNGRFMGRECSPSRCSQKLPS